MTKELSYLLLTAPCLLLLQYTVAVEELIFTTISGVIAVNAVGFVLIPHWTAVLYIFPVIIMLYFNLLGKCNYVVHRLLSNEDVCLTSMTLASLSKCQGRCKSVVFISMPSPTF